MSLVCCKSATSEGYDAYFANWSCWLSLSLQSSVVNMVQASIEGSLECKAFLTQAGIKGSLKGTIVVFAVQRLAYIFNFYVHAKVQAKVGI